MTPTPSKSEGYRLVDVRCIRIYRRLHKIGAGPAAFFQDACRHIDAEPPYATTTHLVSHCLREIESSLRVVLAPLAIIERPEAKGAENDTRNKQILAILRYLGIAEEAEIAQFWLSLSSKDNFNALHKRAHRNNLDQPRSFDDEFRVFWRKMLDMLDLLLDRFEANYTKSFDALDKLLAVNASTSKDAKRLKMDFPQNLMTLSYFFDNLQTGKWLRPLHEQGFFSNPPEQEVDAITGEAQFFSPWPASRYLTRIALDPQYQDTVLDIVREITFSQNPHVQLDIVQILNVVSPEKAVNILPAILQWLE